MNRISANFWLSPSHSVHTQVPWPFKCFSSFWTLALASPSYSGGFFQTFILLPFSQNSDLTASISYFMRPFLVSLNKIALTHSCHLVTLLNVFWVLATENIYFFVFYLPWWKSWSWEGRGAWPAHCWFLCQGTEGVLKWLREGGGVDAWPSMPSSPQRNI